MPQSGRLDAEAVLNLLVTEVFCEVYSSTNRQVLLALQTNKVSGLPPEQGAVRWLPDYTNVLPLGR